LRKTGFTPANPWQNHIRETMKHSLSEAQHALRGLGELLLILLCSGGGVLALLFVQIFYRRFFLSVLLGIFSLTCIITTLWLVRSGWHGMLGIPLVVGTLGSVIAVRLLIKNARN
jgi:hypothetical protein